MTTKRAGDPGALRNAQEEAATDALASLFSSSSDKISDRLDNFPKYTRLQAQTRFLTRYEIFKKIVAVKGSVVECGVFRGGGLMTWANLSAILEPANFMRRIYGFDTFDGFASVHDKDQGGKSKISSGQLCSDSAEELRACIEAFDKNRYLGHMDKVKLVKGDATQTIPSFLNEHPHLVVSLLYLDFDLYEPTRVAIENFLPRMPKGAVIAFDEIDHPTWPGETLAAIESVGLGRLRLERAPFDPYVGFAVLD